MSSPPIVAGNSNPYYGEAPMFDILIRSQKTNLWLASATLGFAVLALIVIIAYVLKTQGLESLHITTAGLGSGLTLITSIISGVGINTILERLGELRAAQYLASLPSLSPEQAADLKVLMALALKTK
jgi:hypothetical protein